MKRLIGALAALALGAGATVLGGCGSSQTKTVSVAGAPALTNTTPTTTTTAKSAPTTGATTTAPTGTAGGTAAPGPTHTASEPEFTQQESHAEGVSEAAAVLKAKGYAPAEASQYHPNQTLRVLIGAKAGSSDGYDQQAFFFVGGRYIGTDAKEPSASIAVLSQSDTEVTLGYPLYRAGDPLASPSGGQAIVHFQLNNGKLTALNPIPPASSTAGTARR